MAEFLKDFDETKPSRTLTPTREQNTYSSTDRKESKRSSSSDDDETSTGGWWKDDVSIAGFNIPAPLFWITLIALTGKMGKSIYNHVVENRVKREQQQQLLQEQQHQVTEEKEAKQAPVNIQRLRELAQQPLSLSVDDLTEAERKQMAQSRRPAGMISESDMQTKLQELSMQYEQRQHCYKEYIRKYQQHMTQLATRMAKTQQEMENVKLELQSQQRNPIEIPSQDEPEEEQMDEPEAEQEEKDDEQDDEGDEQDDEDDEDEEDEGDEQEGDEMEEQEVDQERNTSPQPQSSDTTFMPCPVPHPSSYPVKFNPLYPSTG